ncbi:nucleoside-diphosphate sugar epimerase/dehydratase [Pseudidiomarina terrestris]|uniref:polysaccharide biosynthesis protein n=1 Tax=Pseudidiomarina terrestris TaxID=2820060 RepID=UPI002B05BBF3|nr:nucleoside-diphosphate sugar epimerase/dehydratase [Pseudidiomarina sp. 1APP75-27a]
MKLLTSLLQLPRPAKRAISVIIDIFAILASLTLALLLSRDVFSISSAVSWLGVVTWLLVGSIAVFVKLGLYRAVVRYVSVRAFGVVLTGAIFSTLLLYGLLLAFKVTLPATGIVNYGLTTLLLIGGSRFAMRAIYHRMVSRKKIPVMIYGAGSAGRQLAQALNNGEEFSPVVLVDDDKTLQKTVLLGIPVIDPAQVPDAVEGLGIERILLALPSASRAVRKTILESLETLNVRVQTVPGMADMVNGEMAIDQLQDVRIEDLLGRDPVDPDPALMQQHIRGKVVLVTGAGGSIGSELCRQIVMQKPKALVLYEISEFGLYSIERELREIISRHKLDGITIYPIIGTVQRRNRIAAVMKSFHVQTVYHAAAYKHVPLVEFNMVEGVRNNVFGTWHTAEAAIAANVELFVLISTDKAVRPTNVMGTTKRLSELVLQGLAQRNSSATRFAMVRFGNVLGSSGSVVPLFKKQIEQGGPVTVTHPDITRYFMTIPEAAQLVIQAGTMGDTGAVFVLDMGEPVKIVDMALKMIHLSGLEVRSEAHPDGDIEIVYSGLRPGEKLYEELLIGDDVVACDHPRICRAQELALDWPAVEVLLEELNDACINFRIDELRAILLRAPTGYAPSEEGINDLIWSRMAD